METDKYNGWEICSNQKCNVDIVHYVGEHPNCTECIKHPGELPNCSTKNCLLPEGHKGNCYLCDPGTVYDFLKENEIDRLRLALIRQISRTRQLQERLEMVEEATNSCLRKELSELACIYAIRAIAVPIKITDKDREIAKNLVDKTE